jgi:hypothetical protein
VGQARGDHGSKALSRTITPSAIDDLRQDLTSAAASSQRRNTPLFLVLLSLLGLVLCAGWAWHCRSLAKDAARDADLAKLKAKEITLAAAKLRGLMEAEAAGNGVRASQPMSQLLSVIEAAGARAGLKKQLPVGSRVPQPRNAEGWQQVKLTYAVRDESLAAVMKWIDLAQEEVEGLAVSAIKIRPEANEWSVNVTFSRWEKAEVSS